MANASENMGLWIEEEQRKLDEIKEKLSRISSIVQGKPASDRGEVDGDSMKELKFLLVEDNLEDEFLMLRLLSKLKYYNVKVVRHGQEALNFLFGGSATCSSKLVMEKPDLILLDLRMPIMDGVEFLETASDSLRKNGIPVVITSSCYQEKNVSKCEELGAKAYLRKPIYADELEKAINDSVGSNI